MKSYKISNCKRLTLLKVVNHYALTVLLALALHGCSKDDGSSVLNSKPYEFSGIIMNEHDEPVRNGKVMIYVQNTSNWNHAQCEEMTETTTDENGRFSISFARDCKPHDRNPIEMYVFDEGGDPVPKGFRVAGHIPNTVELQYTTPYLTVEGSYFNNYSHDKITEQLNRNSSTNDEVYFNPDWFAYVTNNINFNFKGGFSSKDTLYVVTYRTFWNYTIEDEKDKFYIDNDGSIYFADTRHIMKVIKVVPEEQGSTYSCSFKSTAGLQAFIEPNSVPTSRFFVTCNSDLVNDKVESASFPGPRKDVRDDSEFSWLYEHFEEVKFEKQKIRDVNEFNITVEANCGNIIVESREADPSEEL